MQVQQEFIIDMGRAKQFMLNGNLIKAKDILEVAIVDCKEKLGSENELLANMLDMLFFIMKKLGQFEEAEKLAALINRIYKKTKGSKHPETIRTMMMIGNVKLLKKNPDELRKAMNIFNTCIINSEAILGKNNHLECDGLSNIATIYYRQGKFAEALSYFDESLKISEIIIASQPAEKPFIYHLQYNIYLNKSDIYRIMEDYDRAEKCAKQVINIMNTRPKEEKNFYTIGLVNLCLSRIEEGRGYREQSLDILQNFMNNFSDKLENNNPIVEQIKHRIKCLVDYVE